MRAAQRALAEPASWSTRLSTEQLRFYFLHQMNPADPDIYICRTLRIAGVLDDEILRESVLDLARRHDILRSCYPKLDGQPQIWLRDEVDAAFIAIDLSQRPAAERAARADELISNEVRAREPLRVDEGPLFRVTAIKLGDSAHVLVFRFHHLIMDGTSVRLFLNGLWETYRALSEGNSLARPRHQYRDFIEWESARLADEARAEERDYWARKLARPTVLDLTIGKRRPERHTREAGTVHAFASPGLVARLRTTCRELHVTPYVVLIGVFQILLRKVTGQQDVLVGTPIGCRQRVEFLPMLGVLLNWVAFRTQVRPEMTFKEVLSHVRAEFPEAYSRQCSYESLISAAGFIPRDPARNPLFQVTLNYATHRELAAPADSSVELDPIVNEETHYDLSVRFEEIGDSLGLGLTFYRGAMERGTAENLCTTLLGLAEHCLTHPDLEISAARLPEQLEVAAPHRVVIASTFTAEHILPTLAYWLDQVGLRSEIDIAPLDQVFQTLLAPSHNLGTNVLLIRFEDWKNTESAVPEFCQLLASHAERASADTIVVVCPPSEANRSSPNQHAFERAIASVAESSGRVHFLSWRTILSIYPVEVIDDAESDAYAKAPYSEDFNVALGTAVARKIYSVVTPTPKVLVLDCDNTLWRGVVGEDGDAIEIDEAARALQALAIERRDAGVLLCLVSKNNEADVWEAFETAPGMLLKREMIVAHRINWEPKSRSIESLAAELNLGVDSFLFIDDSPAECAEVRSACPGVLVLQLPAESDEISRFLQHLWPLDLRKITDADRKRAERYATNARREQLLSETRDLAQFIESLEVRISFVPFSKETASRAAQLTQRTNQFNTTTVRRSEAELSSILDGGGELLLADVSDRFGDYGIVGLVVYRCGAGVLEVDALLVSCRALGRGVEQRMLRELGRIAGTRGLERIELAYRRTAKNRPALQFLEAMAEQHRDRYRISVPEALAAAGKLVTVELDQHHEEAIPLPTEVPHELWQKIAALDSIPRIRGEVDSALARPRSGCRLYVAPRDELEASIAREWSEVLRISPIGANDDYFAIGGDSIRSLTLVSKLRKAGLPATVLDIHEHPTVAQLAQVIRERTASVVVAVAPELKASHGVGPYPLSFSQREVVRAYARENLQPKVQPSGAFHIQDRLIVREKRSRHSMDALRRAIDVLIQRTPTLRARIFQSGESWMQADLAPHPSLEVVDVSQLDHDEQQKKINELLFEDRMRPFDPEHSGAPMIRFYAILRSPADFDLVVTAHHGFCDGWSLQGFYNHLFSLYEANQRGDDALNPGIDGSFRELVDHEQRAIGSEPLDAFWRTYLPSRVHAPEVRETRRTGYQPRLIVHGDPSLIARANERAKASRTSLKAVLLESFSAVLATKLEARSPLVLAVVTNGRKDDLTAPTEVFGLCWTFAPIVATQGDRASRLTNLHRDLIATEAHARYPIEGMFQGFAPESVVHASFNLTSFHNSRWHQGTDNLEITKAESFHRFHFPLNFNIGLVESSKSVFLKVSWSSDAYDRAFAAELLDEFSAELELE